MKYIINGVVGIKGFFVYFDFNDVNVSEIAYVRTMF